MSTDTATTLCQLQTRLSEFMARPQRHRLLHGYPLAAAMPYADEEVRHRAADGDPAFVLPRRFDLLVTEGLLNVSQQDYSLTPRGMFFSDSIAALLAESRWQNLNDLQPVAAANDNSTGHM